MWNSGKQWGDQCYFSHGSSQSAGVSILFNKFRGDTIESFISEEGRWIILVLKLDNIFLIICNVYSHNNTSQSKILFTYLCTKLTSLKSKYNGAHIIIGGDFNDAPDDLMDRIPARLDQHSRFKSTAFVCEQLSVIVVWRFYTLIERSLLGVTLIDLYNPGLTSGL